MFEKNLNKKTKIIGNNIIYFKEINSTQTKIRELAEKKVENGTVVITDNQTNGIGTHDRKWYTEKAKNLTFSMVVYPKCTVKQLDTLTIDIAKIITNAIKKLYGIKLDIKKPNDVIFNGKKIGGILTQIISSGEKIKYLLIGIGFNVNQVIFSDDIKEIATSLKFELNKEFSREDILEEILFGFENYFRENKII